MMKPKYKVLVAFGDGADKSYQYKVGDEYPRYGFEPTEERLAALTSVNNASGKVVLEELPEPKVEEPKRKKGKDEWN